MGLGRHGGGVGAARWLAQQGAVVAVTDLADEAALADSLAELQDQAIARYQLGGHCERDFRDADVVVVNPAVRPGNPWVEMAAAAGAMITTEMEVFLNACPANMVGVTGSNGKSTTSAMIAAILAADGRRTWLGGNLGASLLGDLERMTANDWVVLEMSSFQLAQLAKGTRLPKAAVITNCSPNHLDWHGSWPAYTLAKQRLIAEQSVDSLAVFDAHDQELARWTALVRGRLLQPLDDERIPALKIPGLHNRRNAACAAAAAAGLHCSSRAIECGLTEYRGLPHRLELVLEARERKFYNDSMATTPESVMAAIDALGNSTWLLVGGYDKGVDYSELIAKLAQGVRGAAFYGAVREKLAAIISRHETAGAFHACETLAEAVAWCFDRSRSGDSIALSPGCASYDQFRDYRHRAAEFFAIAQALARRYDR
jgi:UDP-N-acetylmuramoylalanine--D-glutamate ligase